MLNYVIIINQLDTYCLQKQKSNSISKSRIGCFALPNNGAKHDDCRIGSGHDRDCHSLPTICIICATAYNITATEQISIPIISIIIETSVIVGDQAPVSTEIKSA